MELVFTAAAGAAIAGFVQGLSGFALAGGLAGLPLGLWLLPRLDVPMFQATLGLMLVASLPLLLSR